MRVGLAHHAYNLIVIVQIHGGRCDGISATTGAERNGPCKGWKLLTCHFKNGREVLEKLARGRQRLRGSPQFARACARWWVQPGPPPALSQLTRSLRADAQRMRADRQRGR